MFVSSYLTHVAHRLTPITSLINRSTRPALMMHGTSMPRDVHNAGYLMCVKRDFGRNSGRMRTVAGDTNTHGTQIISQSPSGRIALSLIRLLQLYYYPSPVQRALTRQNLFPPSFLPSSTFTHIQILLLPSESSLFSPWLLDSSFSCLKPSKSFKLFSEERDREPGESLK